MDTSRGGPRCDNSAGEHMLDPEGYDAELQRHDQVLYRAHASFEHSDAQSYRFPRQRFDLAVSRFGTMFFANPVVAFTNIGQALRPAGRMVMMVWQTREHNEWAVAIHQ